MKNTLKLKIKLICKNEIDINSVLTKKINENKIDINSVKVINSNGQPVNLHHFVLMNYNALSLCFYELQRIVTLTV